MRYPYRANKNIFIYIIFIYKETHIKIYINIHKSYYIYTIVILYSNESKKTNKIMTTVIVMDVYK